MEKVNNKGFMLAETLIVTTFVAGILIYLFIQFSTLNKGFENSYNYNTVEDLYALEDVKEYIKSDPQAFNSIENSLLTTSSIDITNCTIFTNKNYCLKLFELINIDHIIISLNEVNYKDYRRYDQGFQDFVKKIKRENVEKYRIVASFKDSTYATLRFGDENE